MYSPTVIISGEADETAQLLHSYIQTQAQEQLHYSPICITQFFGKDSESFGH